MITGIETLVEDWHTVINTRQLLYDYLYSKQHKDFEGQLKIMAEISRLTSIINEAKEDPGAFYTKEYSTIEMPSKL